MVNPSPPPPPTHTHIHHPPTHTHTHTHMQWSRASNVTTQGFVMPTEDSSMMDAVVLKMREGV
jgi:hypothetical protein